MTEDRPNRKTVSRALRWLAIVAGVIVLLFVIAVGVLLTADLGRFKSLVESVASDTLKRDVRIEGELSIRVGGQLRVDASGLRVLGVEGDADLPAVAAGHIFVDLDTRSLLRGPIGINSVTLEDVVLRVDTTREAVEVEEEEPGKGSPQLPELHDVSISNLRVDVVGESATSTLVVDNGTLDLVDGNWVLDVGGALNDEALSLGARFGPIASLGRDEPLALQMAGKFGLVEVESEFSTESATTLANPALKIRVQGGDAAYLFNLLNAPVITSGPLDVAVDLGRSGDGEPVSIDGRGQLGEFALQARGSVDKLLDPKTGNFDLQVSGPNLGRVAALFGVESLPETEFSTSAGLRIEPSVFHVDRLHVENAGATLDASGRIGREADLADSQITLRASGGDIEPFAPLLGLPPQIHGSFEADVGLDTRSGSAHALVLDARVGEIRATVKSDVLPLPGTERTRLAIEFAGPDVSILDESVAGMLKAPFPYDLAGNVELRRDFILLESVRIDAGEDEARVILDGRVEPAAKKATLDVNAETPNIRQLLGRFGIDLAVDGALALKAGVTASPDRIALADIDLVLEKGRVTGALDLEPGADPPAVRFDLGIDGLSLAGIIPAGEDWQPANLPLSGTIRGNYAGDSLAFDDLHLVAGDAILDSKGQIDIAGKAKSTLTFNLKVPSIAAVVSSDVRDIPAVAFGASGQVASEPGALRFANTKVDLGGSQLSLDGEYRAGDRPFLRLALQSQQIDLKEFVDPPVEKQPEKKPKTGDEKVDRLIPDVVFPVELLDAWDLSLEINLRNVLGHRMDFNEARLRATLAKGALSVEDFGFDSTHGKVDGKAGYMPGEEGRRFTLDMRGQGIQLAGPKREEPATRATRPATDLEVSLNGVGQDLRALFSTLNGQVIADISAGRMPLAYRSWLADLVLGDFAFEFLDTLNPFTKREDDLSVECAVVLLSSTSGRISGKPLVVFRTSRMTVFGLGNINLATEAIDLDFNTKLRKGIGVSIGDVVNPYTRIGGTLAAPKMTVDEKGAILEGGAAIATGGLTILAKGLHGRFLSDDDPCNTALENFRNPK